MEAKNDRTVLEHILAAGNFTYRKILRVDLELDRCTVLKSDPEGWQPGEGPFTGQMARFALDGFIHREDAERFITFTRLDQLRRISGGGQETVFMVYRRECGTGFRWNLMEVIPDPHGEPRFVTLCIKDIDDALGGKDGTSVWNQDLFRSLEDRAYIISSLSSLFFSTYYLDLEHDTFRPVTQLSRVGDILGDEVNYSAALQIYANHFIHPEDREEYLGVMDVKNLRENLRWWTPCIAFEYRRLSEQPASGPSGWGWVRASAIMARTGEDDLPKTAVYVAQDIADSRRKNESM